MCKTMEKFIRKIKKSRRYRVAVIKRFLLLFATLIIISLVFMKVRTSASASESDPYGSIKCYVRYEVEEGDTLWKLAETFGPNQDVSTFINEVITINHLSNADFIKEGNVLVLPYYQMTY